MVITDEIDISDCGLPHKSGGFADVQPGQYNGRTVAVKTLRVTMTDDFDKTRKVRRETVLETGITGTALKLLFRVSYSAKKRSFGIRYLIRTS